MNAPDRPLRRPRWKRLAGNARDLAYRVVSFVDWVGHSQRGILLPPAHLRIYYYRKSDPRIFIHACDIVRAEVISRGLQAEHRVLDIGSGIGNLALGLVDYLHGGYDGVEIHHAAVAWCQRAITARYPTFRFHHADLASEAYNPSGRGLASTYRFPFADQAFDFIFLGSVFTHMLPDALANYTREIARMLRPGGVCVASYFLLNDESRRAVNAGCSFMSFATELAEGLCRVHASTRPERAVAVEESYVRGLYEAAGLSVRDVRRGQWWSGLADDQDLVTAVLSP